MRSVWSADFDDISAMHLHPKDVGAAIVSVDEPRPASSWRWGGPPWQGDQTQRDTGRQGIRGLTLQAREPETLARRWAQVLGRADPVRLDPGPRWRVALSDGFADFEGGASDGVAGFTLAVDRPADLLAQARAAGLAVDDQQLTLLGARLRIEPV